MWLGDLVEGKERVMFVCFLCVPMAFKAGGRIAGRVMLKFVCSRSGSSRCDELRVGRCGRLFAKKTKNSTFAALLLLIGISYIGRCPQISVDVCL